MKAFLTIPETCVWAATLSPEAVAYVSNSDPEGAHFLLEDALPPFPCGAHVSVWRARCAQQALAQLPDLCGKKDGITMTGILRDCGDRESIPVTVWADLEIFTSARWGGFTAGLVHNPDASWWTRLRISLADVHKIWPAPLATTIAREGFKARKPTPDELDAWYLTEWVAKHDPSQPPPSREDDGKAAEKYFKRRGLGRAARAARARVAPDDWKVAGSKGRKRAAWLAQSGQK